MTTDEIKLALRLVAMGRVNHPQVDELAEALAGVFSRKCGPLPVVEMSLAEMSPALPETVEIVSDSGYPTEAEVKRAVYLASLPKSRKKAD